MGGRGDYVRVWERRWIRAGHHETGIVRCVNEEIGTDPVCDGTKAGKVDDPRITRSAGYDKLRLVLLCEAFHLLIVDDGIVASDPVTDRIEPLARHCRRSAVGKMTASSKRHAKNSVTRLQQSHQHCAVSLRARMGLHICESTTKQGLCTIDGNLLDHVNMLAAAIA